MLVKLSSMDTWVGVRIRMPGCMKIATVKVQVQTKVCFTLLIYVSPLCNYLVIALYC